ncbi:uncharacterized protein LOC141649078 [Silene latifolia]|uniref:uncharacterized protein LOC141649078 n=1 Tax=Silene latifolia TaxID=37657 RepID=UPI003D76E739
MDSIGYWNIRGMNKLNKQLEIRRFIQLNNISLFGILETRIKNKNWGNVRRNIWNNWAICTNNSCHSGGRIWVVWNPSVYHLDVKDMSEQAIHLKVTTRGNLKQFWVTFVYGFNKIAERRNLWRDLRTFSSMVDDAWIIGGDFNNVLYSNDRLGSEITLAEVKPFLDCTHDCKITDLKAVGSFFTWNNKQEVATRVYSRIDRTFINDEWLEAFPDAYAHFMTEGTFDHCPCVIHLDGTPRRKIAAFKYYNMCALAPTFQEIVEKCWSSPVMGTPMFRVAGNQIKKIESMLLIALNEIQKKIRESPFDPDIIAAEIAI